MVTTQMRAVVFERPAADASATQVRRIPIPEPGPGHVTIDVRFAGINFKDVMARRGDTGYVDSWPFVPGLEVSGTVRALGAGVDRFAVGDRVVALTGAGGLAEVASAPAQLTVPLPAGLAMGRAAAAPGALTTAVLLVDDIARVRTGDTLLVHSAAGGVGQSVARLARLAGARSLIGTVGHPGRIAAAERAGYDRVVLRHALTPDTVIDDLGAQPDIVLDPHGTRALDLDLAAAAPGARVILFGNTAGGALDALPPVARLFAGNASIGGFSLAAFAASAPHTVARALIRVLHLLAAGELDIERTLIEQLDDVADAQQALSQGQAHGKQVVDLAPGA